MGRHGRRTKRKRAAHRSEVSACAVQQMLLDKMQGRCRKSQANARGAASKFTALGTVQQLQEVNVEFGGGEGLDCVVRGRDWTSGQASPDSSCLSRELGSEGDARKCKGQQTGGQRLGWERTGERREGGKGRVWLGDLSPIEPWGKGCSHCSHCSQVFLGSHWRKTKAGPEHRHPCPGMAQASCFRCFHSFRHFRRFPWTRPPARTWGPPATAAC